MKIARTAAAATLSAALVLTLGACSGDSSGDEKPTTVVSEEATDDVDVMDDDSADDSTDDDSAGDSDEGASDDDQETSDDSGDFEEPADPAGVAESCEEFNTLSADLRAVDPDDSDGYDDVYLRSQDAKDAAPTQELYDVFAVLSLLALDAGLGEDTTETMETLGQAVFAAAGTCTAEDVTLTIS